MAESDSQHPNRARTVPEKPPMTDPREGARPSEQAVEAACKAYGEGTPYSGWQKTWITNALRAAYAVDFGGSAAPPEDEEDSCEDERMRLAVYDRICLEAAKAIKESDHWAENHWPSMVDRLWYVVAQEEIARLRAALRATPTGEETP